MLYPALASPLFNDSMNAISSIARSNRSIDGLGRLRLKTLTLAGPFLSVMRKGSIPKSFVQTIPNYPRG